MKNIKILALLALIYFLIVGTRDFVAGWTDASNEPMETLNVTLPLNAIQITDSLAYAEGVVHYPYVVNRIKVYADKEMVGTSGWFTVVNILGAFATLFMMYGIYCLVRLVLSITRRSEVFSRVNIWRIRCFAYGGLAMALYTSLIDWMEYNELASKVQLTGYEVDAYSPTGAIFLSLVLALLAEIFVAAVKIKEEQDLTI